MENFKAKYYEVTNNYQEFLELYILAKGGSEKDFCKFKIKNIGLHNLIESWEIEKISSPSYNDLIKTVPTEAVEKLKKEKEKEKRIQNLKDLDLYDVFNRLLSLNSTLKIEDIL